MSLLLLHSNQTYLSCRPSRLFPLSKYNALSDSFYRIRYSIFWRNNGFPQNEFFPRIICHRPNTTVNKTCTNWYLKNELLNFLLLRKPENVRQRFSVWFHYNIRFDLTPGSINALHNPQFLVDAKSDLAPTQNQQGTTQSKVPNVFPVYKRMRLSALWATR